MELTAPLTPVLAPTFQHPQLQRAQTWILLAALDFRRQKPSDEGIHIVYFNSLIYEHETGTSLPYP